MADTVTDKKPGRLSKGEKSYYRRVEALESSGEESHLLTQNLLAQVHRDGVRRVLCDKVGSRAVESCLARLALGPGADPEDKATLLRLLLEVVPAFSRLAGSRCGSHAVQALLRASGRLAREDEGIARALVSLSREVKGLLGDMLQDTYATHVLATLVQVLGGKACNAPGSSQPTRIASQLIKETFETPPEFLHRLKALGKAVRKLPELQSLVCHQHAVPTLVVTAVVLRHTIPNQGAKFNSRLLKCCSEPHTLLQEAAGSYLMEVLIKTSSAEQCKDLYKRYMKGHVRELALHPIANHPLQQFLLVASPALVEHLIAELHPVLEEVLCQGHLAVVAGLAQACVRVQCGKQQALLLDSLLEAFHASSSPDQCFLPFLTFTTHDVYYSKGEDKPPVHPLGSVLLLALLSFKNTEVVSGSFTGLSAEDVLAVACDPSGSRAVESFMSSPSVKHKDKLSIVGTLKGHFGALCRDKHGSYVLETLWFHCKDEDKESIAAELLAQEHSLSTNFHCKFVFQNINLLEYKDKANPRKRKAKETKDTLKKKRRT